MEKKEDDRQMPTYISRKVYNTRFLIKIRLNG